MRTKLAIVGIFYDGYYDIWEDFLELLERNWSDNLYPVYIVNNTKEIKFERNYNVKVLHAGDDAEYSRKVQMAVDSIDADYYLLLLEDFFLSENVNNQNIIDIISNMEQNNLKYCRMTIPDFLSKRDLRKPFGKITEKFEYTVSCQPSIWEKSFLKKCIGTENYNAWVFEGIYAKSTEAHSKDFLSGCVYDYTNPLKLRHGLVQGKILPPVYKDFINKGYEFKAHREIMTNRQYKKYKLKQVVKEYIPIKIQQILKKVMKNQSVTNKYDSEITLFMKKMNIV